MDGQADTNGSVAASADDGVNIPLLRNALKSIATDGKPAAAPAAPAASEAPISPNEIVVREPPPSFVGIDLPARSSEEPVIGPGAPAEPPEPPEVKKDPKARSAWEFQKKENKTLKEQLAQAEKARKEIAASVEQLKTQKTAREAELEQAVERLETEIGRFSLEATSEFRNRRVRPIEEAKSKAASALIRAGKSPEEAHELVRYLMADTTTSDDIETSIGDLPKFAQGIVAASVFDAKELDQARQRDLENWKQARAALEADESKKDEQIRKVSLVRDTAKAVQDLTETYGSWVFKANPDSPEWEAQRERLVLEAQHVLAEGTDQDLARAVVESTAAQYYRKWGESLMRQNEELRHALEQRDASRPRLGIGGQGAPKAPEPVSDAKAPISLEQGLRLAGVGR